MMLCFKAHEEGRHRVTNKKNARVRLNNLFMRHKNNDLNHKFRASILDLWFLHIHDKAESVSSNR